MVFYKLSADLEEILVEPNNLGYPSYLSVYLHHGITF